MGHDMRVVSGWVQQHAHRLISSRFVRNVATVATGIAAAQAISFAFMPFLTRLYSPAAFGALAAFTAVLNIITPLGTLGYSSAIVMPESEEDAAAVARLSLMCGALVAPMALVGIFLFQTQLASWTGLEVAPGLLYLIPFSLLLSAVLSVANQAAIREGLFKARASSRVVSTLLMNVGKLVGGVLKPSGLLLIIVSMAGQALNTVILLGLVPRKGVFRVKRWFGTTGTWRAAKEHRDFACFRLPHAIINAASIGLPVILLTAYFGVASAGQYSITTLVLGAPIMLIGQSVVEVFFPKITGIIRENPIEAEALLKRAGLVMALLAIIPFGIIALLGAHIFPFVFGEEWGRAGQYSQWVAIWMGSVLVTRPAIAAIPALRLQGTLLIYEILATGARIAAIVVGARVGSDLTAVAAFSLVNVAGYLLLYFVVMHRAAKVRRQMAVV